MMHKLWQAARSTWQVFPRLQVPPDRFATRNPGRSRDSTVANDLALSVTWDRRTASAIKWLCHLKTARAIVSGILLIGVAKAIATFSGIFSSKG